MIYGGNTVTHVSNENSFPRASCGYILVELMLTRPLIQKTYAKQPPSDLQATSKRPPSDDDTLNPGLYVALFDRMMDKVKFWTIRSYVKLHRELRPHKKEMAVFATSELWLQYMAMVDLLRDFIRSHSTGS